VRWFGGALKDADINVCVVGDIEPDYRLALESLGARINIVPRFDPANPLFNKIQLFRLPSLELYDALFYLDCDTIVVQDPSRFLSSSVLRIKVADVATIPTELLERVCGYFGLTPPERDFRTNLDQADTIWYCNAGVVNCPVQFIPRLIPDWCEYELAFSANPDLLGAYQHHRSQAALALAFIANPLPFEELPVEMNFPLHLTGMEAPLEMLDADPVILHYHDLVDSGGYLLPSPYPLAQKRIEQFNERLREVGLPARDATSERHAVSISSSKDHAGTRVKLNDHYLRPRARGTQMVVCVAGMHRSGTSMVARMIHTCGVYFGPERILEYTSRENERGYWENVNFVTLNDALLDQLGGRWDMPPPRPESWNNAGLEALGDRALELIKQLSDLRRWGWKDPRNSITLPFWRQLVPNLKVVICLRHPLEVIQSLVKRGSSVDDSLLDLWLTYNQQLMTEVPPENRLITHYASYFVDPQQELRRVLGFLGIAASDRAVELACATVSRSLRHNVALEDFTEIGIPDEVPDEYFAMCSEAGPLCERIKSATHKTSVPRRDYRDILRLMRLEAELEQSELMLRTRESELASVKTKMKAVESDEDSLRERLAERQAELNKITSTLGWRLLSHYGRFKYRFLLPAYRFFIRNDYHQKDDQKDNTGRLE